MDNIIANITESLLNTSSTFQLTALFVFSFGEGVPGLGTFLPGGTIAVLAGALSASGEFPPFLAAVIISVGSFLGDAVGYILGKKFKHISFVNNIINNEKHQKMWDLFDRHVAIISIFGKLVPLVRSTPSVIAGARGIVFRKYMLYSFVGSLIWGMFGVYAGRVMSEYFGDMAIKIIVGVLVVTVCIFCIKYIYSRFFTSKIVID